MKSRLPASLLLAFGLSAIIPSHAPAKYPPTEKKPVTDEYHGIKVVDDYRWLEEAGSPPVKASTQAQNAYSRAYLDALPDRAGVEQRLTGWYAKDTPSQ